MNGMTACPCGSGTAYGACCGPLHDGAPAPTAEALMRSRYTAYALDRTDQAAATWSPRMNSVPQGNLMDSVVNHAIDCSFIIIAISCRDTYQHFVSGSDTQRICRKRVTDHRMQLIYDDGVHVW